MFYPSSKYNTYSSLIFATNPLKLGNGVGAGVADGSGVGGGIIN